MENCANGFCYEWGSYDACTHYDRDMEGFANEIAEAGRAAVFVPEGCESRVPGCACHGPEAEAYTSET